MANSILNKGKSAIPLLFNGPEVLLSSASDEAKLFAKNVSKNSNLDDSDISLPVFPSISNLKLHNISATPNMVEKVITNLDLSMASGPDFIPVVVLKNCERELFYKLAELFNKCQKESCFPDCWKVSSVVPVFKIVGERSTAKNCRSASLLSVVSNVFEKLVNNRIVDHLEKCDLFSDSLYGFTSSQSTADLLTVVPEKIGRATRAVALDISKAFDRVVLFTNLSFMEFQVRYLAVFLIYQILWTEAGSGLFISILEKLSWFHSTVLITLVLLMVKWIGQFLRKSHLLRCWC